MLGWYQLLVSKRRRAAKPLRGPRLAVRKGTPRSHKHDIYYSLMEGSWPRLLTLFAVVFVGLNSMFGFVYWMLPRAISGEGTWAEAFFFSVQTMSTIGYGGLVPTSTAGNSVVVAEAALSMLGVAATTGLVFAKLSRPRARVLFSSPVVVTQMHGVPTLCVRLGNTRRSEVVDATVTLSVLVQGDTPENHRFRRILDLPLVRNSSPMFALTWTVMHVIDASSPLYIIDLGNPAEEIVFFVITLGGHDGTYGQMVYDRHLYYPEDLQVGRRFVDVVSTLEDGRTQLDYDRFHLTEPDLGSRPTG